MFRYNQYQVDLHVYKVEYIGWNYDLQHVWFPFSDTSRLVRKIKRRSHVSTLECDSQTSNNLTSIIKTCGTHTFHHPDNKGNVCSVNVICSLDKSRTKVCTSNSEDNNRISCIDIKTLTINTIPKAFTQLLLVTSGYPLKTPEMTWKSASVTPPVGSYLSVELLDMSLHEDDTVLYCNTVIGMVLKIATLSKLSDTVMDECKHKVTGDSWSSFKTLTFDICLSESSQRGVLFRVTGMF